VAVSLGTTRALLKLKNAARLVESDCWVSLGTTRALLKLLIASVNVATCEFCFPGYNQGPIETDKLRERICAR